MLTASQLRAARGLLDWTRNDLAKAAGLSPETIKNIEHGTFRPQQSTIDAIIHAFHLQNVEFTENDGIRRNQNNVTQFEGPEGFKRFMDDVYHAACQSSATEKGNKPIYVSNVDDRLFAESLGDYSPLHSRRMNELQNVKVRVLLKAGDDFSVAEPDYLEYRWNPKQIASDVPFYVYGDKLAIIMFGLEPSPQIIVIHAPSVAATYREQFLILWQGSQQRLSKPD